MFHKGGRSGRLVKVGSGVACALMVLSFVGIAQTGAQAKKAAAPVPTPTGPCGSATKGKTYHIAMVSAVVSNVFYLTMRNGAELIAKQIDKECGVNIQMTYQGAADFTASSEMPVLTSLLAKPVDALLVVPADLAGDNAPLKEFAAKGVPIITLDTTSSDKAILKSAITSDGFGGGEQGAALIGKFAHGKGVVAVNSIAAGVTTTDPRVNGFLAGIKKFPNIKVLPTQYNNFSIPTADSEVGAELLSNPNLVGVFCANETGGEGGGAAVVAAGKKGKVDIVAFDADIPEVPLLKNGTITDLIVQRPGYEGQLGMRYAFDELTGQKKLVQKQVTLANVIATTQGASSPSVTKYYYTANNND